MQNRLEELLLGIGRAVEALEVVQSDSHTPARIALEIVDPLRRLTDCRRALRARAFEIAADDPAFVEASHRLQDLTDAVTSDLNVFESQAALVRSAAKAAESVLRIAGAAGALIS
jgi:hypothetical protein